MHKSEYDGIVFIEGIPSNCKVVRHCEVSIIGFFSQAQIKSLNDVKAKLAKQAKLLNSNAIINFKYGQKSNFWAIFGIDDVAWYGSGDIAIITNNNI